ncbi:glycosyltransferase family 2 protein [Halorussus salinisoli]|uniref:glycosyltransferase family 2 protein n=1 Tax=Halorussus salinisoli TaxID=2558242 RepID=UPI0014855131|nr:glycosyltransferase family A protein [Halorussus salinisoli]
MEPRDDAGQPLVSAVVPTHNRTTRLRRAIKSILDQTYPNLELIVVDDCSVVPAEEVLKPVQTERLPKSQIIRHDTNRGGAAARNTGITAADGEFIAFLDDDDVWEPTKISRQVTEFRSDEVPGVVYTGVKQVDERGNVKAIKTPTTEGDVTRAILLRNFVGTFSAVMIRSEVVDEVGLLDERFPSWQDWEYYLRLSKDWEFRSVPKALVRREGGSHEQSTDNFDERRDVTSELFREKFSPLAAEMGLENEFNAHVDFYLAKSALSNERYADGRKAILRAIGRVPTEPVFYFYYFLFLGGRFTVEPIRKLKRIYVRTIVDTQNPLKN